MTAYLDNAATTPVAPEAMEAMLPYLSNAFGNPSSVHSAGREAKAAVESARKTIAELIHCQPAEILFTSGGTEGNNAIILGTSRNRIITSPVEHHAVLEVVEKSGKDVAFLDVDAGGAPNLDQLQKIADKEALVSLMYVNNEIGTVLDVESVAAICHSTGAFFHSDSVQAIGHLPVDLSRLKIDALTASAHKFHGPKGVGFLFLRNKSLTNAFILGGPQEREWRAGTENVAGIVGMATALKLLCNNMEEDSSSVARLKERLWMGIKELYPDAQINGNNSLYTILNVHLPLDDSSEMLLFQLDLQGVMASGGSACSAGAIETSHVLTALGKERSASIRFSLSRYNTEKEVDHTLTVLRDLKG